MDEAEKYVGGNWDGVRALLGGKGAGLADMIRGKLPVPPGFTVTTEACNAYLAAGEQFPEGLWEQELAAMKATEAATGKVFGDPSNPLLVSCRSGAKFSMPGMMDTVLNIGLNDDTVAGMVKLTGNEKFVYDSYRRLVQMFGSVVMDVDKEAFEKVLEAYRHQAGVASDFDLSVAELKEITAKFQQIVKEHTGREFPGDVYEQLKLATEAVFKSWNGKRAFDYRNASKIAHDLGTAVNICTMVFGNMGQDSGTGVLTTRDVSSGNASIEGDFLINAQGEDVVSGTRQTLQMSDMKAIMPVMYEQARGHLSPARELLPRDPGHRVHRRARHAVDLTDPQRQAHRPGCDPHRGGHGRRGEDQQDRGGQARPALGRGLLSAPAVRHGLQEGRHRPRRVGGHRPERLARRGRGPDHL